MDASVCLLCFWASSLQLHIFIFFFFSCWIQISYTSVSSFQVQTVEFILYALGSLGVLIILEAIWEPEHLPVPITLW